MSRSGALMITRKASTCRRPLHPQTILATRYAKEPITDPFGFPLRLRTATKLGFKNPKRITAIEVTNDLPKTYWSERGFNWFSGI
jgi:DMSO/TMAO reductase YedYZ molybdopterin-dependent catalytic subunit